MQQTPELTQSYNPMMNPDRDDPFTAYRKLRAEAPVAFVPAFNLWLVSRYDDLIAVLRDRETFSTEGSTSFIAMAHPEVAQILIDAEVDRPAVLTDPPAIHARRRMIIGKVFTPQRVAELEPSIRAIAEGYVARFAAAGQVEFMDAFAYPVPIAVLSKFLGIPGKHIELMWQGGVALRVLMGEPAPLEQQHAHAVTILKLRELLAQLIDERRKNPTGDVLSALVAAEDDEGAALTTGDLIRLCLTLAVAGHFTTTHFLGNLMKLVLEDGTTWPRFVVDTSLSGKVVEEALRAEGSLRGMFRRTTQEVELGGATIPAGALVQILFGSANRDPTKFPEPDRFDIDRDGDAPHLAFGRGIHYCIGAALARLQAKVSLEVLAEHLPNLRLKPGSEIPYNPNLWAWGPDACHLEWDPPAQS